jgi:serine/threonine protein phosphatase 1
MARLIIVGDIHGCLEEFKELLKTLDLKPEDTLISLGDLVHKGPHSAEVVGLLRQVNCTVILVSGNHEEKQLRWLGHELASRAEGTKNPMEHVEEYPGVQAGLTDEDLEFIKAAYLYYSFTVKGKKYFCVHGGVSSRTLALPAESLSMRDLALLPKRFRKHLELMLRLRYEDLEGNMVALGDEVDDDVYWADRYNGRFGTILFGHQPFFREGPRVFDHAVALDTGCVHGGLLSALVIDQETGTESTVTVQAKESYCQKKADSPRRPS